MSTNDPFGFLAGDYRTPERKLKWRHKTFPTSSFYRLMLKEVFAAARAGKRDELSYEQYCQHAIGIFRAMEAVGGRAQITGYDQVPADGWPYVFVANHMSVLETFIFAAIFDTKGKHMFVVKKDLFEYPVFKHVMRAIDPVVVGRENPRDDLTEVLRKGAEKIAAGFSMVIFPQKTRALRFEPSQFNTIGIKLARRSNVPIVPVALKTDFWGQGKRLKDFGGIFPEKTVHFHFGAPISIKGKGQEEHEQIIKFIGEHYSAWENE
ncbi:1-acyl-sn-glycerol-3-phosphate acyltransferase [candidate division KSB1 bacterium]|nr:1-acyl-sn-glycerol-3-phosphate acyltransferase [candidate division KSB1 bacterium]RQW06780.1 MAG: 1-acyl-sn-glycerol-3-phosphate acyltransferase [candidate division KSB1 bacterium]